MYFFFLLQSQVDHFTLYFPLLEACNFMYHSRYALRKCTSVGLARALGPSIFCKTLTHHSRAKHLFPRGLPLDKINWTWGGALAFCQVIWGLLGFSIGVVYGVGVSKLHTMAGHEGVHQLSQSLLGFLLETRPGLCLLMHWLVGQRRLEYLGVQASACL